MEDNIKINFVKLIQELSASFTTVSFFEIEDSQCGELIYHPVMKIRAHTPLSEMYYNGIGVKTPESVLQIQEKFYEKSFFGNCFYKKESEEFTIRIGFYKIVYELIEKDSALRDLRILQADLNEIIRKKYHDDHNLSPSARKLVELSKI